VYSADLRHAADIFIDQKLVEAPADISKLFTEAFPLRSW
jgi:hypothetical protein